MNETFKPKIFADSMQEMHECSMIQIKESGEVYIILKDGFQLGFKKCLVTKDTKSKSGNTTQMRIIR